MPERLRKREIDLFSSGVGRRYIGYEVGTVFAYPAYIVASLPSVARLEEDYLEMLAFYNDVVEDPTVPSVDDFVEATASVSVPITGFELVDFAPRAPKSFERGVGRGTAPQRRNRNSIKVGNAGELAVLRAEKEKLTKVGRADLAEKVDHLAARHETPGWDIMSFSEDGTPLFIEVKASKGKIVTSIELTRNEWHAAQQPRTREHYRIYVVTEALSTHPKIEVIANPHRYVEEAILSISPSVYELSLRAQK